VTLYAHSAAFALATEGVRFHAAFSLSGELRFFTLSFVSLSKNVGDDE
jgi:hypothetical protein